MSNQRYVTPLGMCACSRTREFCLTMGCKKDEAEWRYTTEGRQKDRLRRVYDRRLKRAISNWVKPERAIAEAWLMNMEQKPVSSITIHRFGKFDVVTEGVQ